MDGYLSVGARGPGTVAVELVPAASGAEEEGVEDGADAALEAHDLAVILDVEPFRLDGAVAEGDGDGLVGDDGTGLEVARRPSGA